MKEILEYRTQTYLPRLPEKINEFSGIEILNFHEEDLDLPELLVVYHLKTDDEFDRNLLSQLIKDVFHDFFFKKELSSSIQIVEEAVLNVKNKILKILKSSDKNKLEFNLICGIFAKNSISVVKYGKTFASIVRDGDIKELEFAVEGFFGSAQGNIKSGDLFLLSTSDFHKKFVNQNLLKKGLNVSVDDLSPSDSSLILYFNKSLASDSQKNLNINSKKIKKKAQKMLIKYQGVLVLLISIGLGFGAYKYYEYGENQKIVRENLAISENAQNVLGKNSSETLSYSGELLEQISIVGKSNLENKEEIITQLKAKYNEVNKIIEKDFNLVFDFKEFNPRSKTNSMVFFSDTVYVLDTDSSKVYYSKISNIKFESMQVEVENPKHIDVLNRTISIFGKDKINYFSLDLNKNAKELNLEGIGETENLGNLVYELKDKNIFRTDTNSDNPKRESWAESEKLIGAKDIKIDFDVFVLDKNSNLLKFSKGIEQKIEFNNNGFELSKMHIDSNLKNYYFLDQNKIYVFSKDGKFQNIVTDTKVTENITDFVVLSDKKILIITGTKIYQVDL